MASLLVTEGKSTGQKFALEKHRLVMIGRDHQCTFRVLDEHISRLHLQIRYDPGNDRHYAVDFKSANGVEVNGERITEACLLKDGDVIQIGDTRMVYSLQDDADAQRAGKYQQFDAARHTTRLPGD